MVQVSVHGSSRYVGLITGRSYNIMLLEQSADFEPEHLVPHSGGVEATANFARPLDNRSFKIQTTGQQKKLLRR